MTHLRRPRSGLVSNLPQVAEFNSTVVLDAIRRSSAAISRAGVAEATGLAPQTVSDICQRLLDQGLIAEAGTVSNGPGRPRTTLELVPHSRYALGIHIDPAAITYVVLDLVGDIVAHASEETTAANDPDHVITTISARLERLVSDSGIDTARIVGLGIATPGSIDLRSGAVVNPYHLPDWHRVRLRDALTASTGLPVLLDKDVTAAAVAERWAGAALGQSDFAFLYLGTGIGVGSVSGDVVVRGSTANAGDIGHLGTGDGGPLCECGSHGCLGKACSPVHLNRLAVSAGVLDDEGGPEDPISTLHHFIDLCAHAENGHPAALAILTESAERMARALTAIAGLLDVDLIVLGGPAWTPVAEIYLPVLLRDVNRNFIMRDIHDVRIVGTAIGDEVGAVGAAALVLDQTFAASASLPARR